MLDAAMEVRDGEIAAARVLEDPAHPPHDRLPSCGPASVSRPQSSLGSDRKGSLISTAWRADIAVHPLGRTTQLAPVSDCTCQVRLPHTRPSSLGRPRTRLGVGHRPPSMRPRACRVPGVCDLPFHFRLRASDCRGGLEMPDPFALTIDVTLARAAPTCRLVLWRRAHANSPWVQLAYANDRIASGAVLRSVKPNHASFCMGRWSEASPRRCTSH
jgi:hypothetical protein